MRPGSLQLVVVLVLLVSGGPSVCAQAVDPPARSRPQPIPQPHTRPRFPSIPSGPSMPGLRPIPQPRTRPPFPAPIFINTLFTPMLLIWLAVTAAREERRKREEEEVKTPYTEEDLMDDWEFKIIRSACGRFERRESLDMVLREEARAGWQLVEKFDGLRVRLKRRPGAREGDSALPPGHDPYRTVIPPRQTWPMALSWIMFALSAFFLCLFAFLLSRNADSPGMFLALTIGTAAGAVVFGMLAVILTRRFKQTL